MRLDELTAAVGIKYNGDAEITDVVYDSRLASDGCLFVCIKGAVSDGHSFALGAYNNGARFFVCEHELDLPDDAEIFIISDTRIALAGLSKAFFGNADEKLKIIGITGTKGKTTVTSFIRSILETSGHIAATVGTDGILIGGQRTPTKNTTPESYELHRAFSEMVKAGVEYAIIEVSSQSVKMHRIDGISFFAGVFTNLSPDHIGESEHRDFNEYRSCKAELFARSKLCILNRDDENFEFMAKASAGTVITYSLREKADFYASDTVKFKTDTHLGVRFMLKNTLMHINMPGLYSVYNAVCAAAVCCAIGVGLGNVAAGLAGAVTPGRFEIVPALPGCTFIIDYAHNAVSMRSVLLAIRDYNPKRLVCLFGSVGGRTQMRRGELGRIVASLADFCILTSDNPNFEEPMDILREIEGSFIGTSCVYTIIPDRTRAIEYAVSEAREGDVILLAGKGHEKYQLVKGEYLPFDEAAIIRSAAGAMLKI